MELSRRRRIAIWSLLAAGGVVAVLAVFALWTARQLLDERAWDVTSAALIADPAIQTAISGYLVDELYDEVDVAGTLRSALPPRLDGLAAPAAGALRAPAQEAVRRLLERPRVQALWQAAAGATQDQFVNLVEGTGPALRTPSGGGVVIDLRPLLADVGRRLGLPVTGKRLPEDIARIQVMRASQLDTLRTIFRVLKAVTLVLWIVAAALIAVAVWLARGRRRETIAAGAMALILAAIVVLLVRRLIGGGVVGDLAKTATAQDAANAAYSIATSLLAQIARTVLSLALVLLAAAWLAGPSRLARRARDVVRPALTARPELVHGAVVAVLLALLALDVVPGIRTAIAAALLVVVAVIGVELVRRQAVAERPPSRSGPHRAPVAP
jgi:hypothetical protein